MSDREKSERGKLAQGMGPLPTEAPTWPKSVDAVTTPAPDAEGPALPYLRRPEVPERKVTLRDLPVPTPNRKDTIRYQDQLPPSDPPPPPGPGDGGDGSDDELTRLRLAEPVPFYIERDSVPAPEDPLDEAPTQMFDPNGDATTQIKTDERPSAMNFGKLAAPRFASTGEPVKITTGKPSAMRLNRVEARSDATTDAPVETPSRAPRPSLSGQRMHRALPIFTGVAFVAIGAASAVIVVRGGETETQAETPVTPNVATKVVPPPARAAAPARAFGAAPATASAGPGAAPPARPRDTTTATNASGASLQPSPPQVGSAAVVAPSKPKKVTPSKASSPPRSLDELPDRFPY
jgi:hypothetical protein